MRIVNAMFSKNLGGIEQAFLDYTESLAAGSNQVICLIRPKARVIQKIQELQSLYPNLIVIKQISNLGKWDLLAKLRIAVLLKKFKADAVIAHGNRPVALLRLAASMCRIPLIGLVHNYWFKDVLKSDYLISVSSDIRSKLISSYFQNDKTYTIPNLIRLYNAEPYYKPFRSIPVIGTMARMVEKKGIDVFLRALSILDKKNIRFTALIGGDGELRNEMQTLRDDLRLNDCVQFMGWVKDKELFYDTIDIFCLPSLSEPFGIVLLEAMVRKKPLVASNIEGPAEILNNDVDALLFDKGSPEKLAQCLEEMIYNQEQTLLRADRAYKKIIEKYDIRVVAPIINEKTGEIIERWKNER